MEKKLGNAQRLDSTTRHKTQGTDNERKGAKIPMYRGLKLDMTESPMTKRTFTSRPEYVDPRKTHYGSTSKIKVK